MSVLWGDRGPHAEYDIPTIFVAQPMHPAWIPRAFPSALDVGLTSREYLGVELRLPSPITVAIRKELFPDSQRAHTLPTCPFYWEVAFCADGVSTTSISLLCQCINDARSFDSSDADEVCK